LPAEGERRLSPEPNTLPASGDRNPAALIQEGSSPRNSTANSNRNSWLIWLLRARALLLVTLCATFGVLLVILPWTPHWTDNPLLLSSPQLRQIIANGFTRGLVSGLGLLDLWLGFWVAIHYHEN
jgi:hypothetical protein